VFDQTAMDASMVQKLMDAYYRNYISMVIGLLIVDAVGTLGV